MVYFGVNHAKIWHRDHIMYLSYKVYRRLPGLDWFVCCWCHYSYGRKPKAVSNLNFLSFLSCFSWWSSPGRLYEKTTLGMFQWASVLWGGEITITITSSTIITSILTIFVSLRSPEWPLTLKMEVTKSEVQLWRNEQTVSLKHLMCRPKKTQSWNWSTYLYWVLLGWQFKPKRTGIFFALFFMPEYCAYKLSITSSSISDLFVQCIQISQIMSHVKSAPRCLSDLSG